MARMADPCQHPQKSNVSYSILLLGIYAGLGEGQPKLNVVFDLFEERLDC
jgi:hypothetical protein